MKDTNSNGHRLLIQKLLVSIHYLTLFRDEIVLVEKTPSLLGASFSPNIVQSELGEILAAVDALSKQKKLIKSTFWYDEASFRLMNHSLDIVGTWIRGIDNVLEICESKSVFHAILGDNRQRVFGVLIDVFTSLRVTNLSIKEESEYPLLVDPLQVVEYKKREVKKAELMAKIDALTPRKSEEVYDDSKDEKVESIPELVEKELAKEKAPAIIFIDELDAVAAKRLKSSTSGDREVQRTLMQLLAELDGFESRGDIGIIGATNRPDILDPALLRPGRFDRFIEVPLPNDDGRKQILKIHTKNMALDEEADLDLLSSLTDGLSGADLKAVCTEAGMFAIREKRDRVTVTDFMDAVEKVLDKEHDDEFIKEAGVMFA